MAELSTRPTPRAVEPALSAAAIAPYAPGPRLSPEQMECLRSLGTELALAPGDILFRAGEPYRFALVLEGLVEVIDDFAGLHQLVVSRRTEGHFIGEFGVLENHHAPVTAVAREASRVVTLPSEAVRKVIDEEPVLSDIILHAFLERRAALIRAGGGLKVVGSRFSAGTHRILEFLARNRIAFAWLDVERDAAADEVLRTFAISPAETPVVVCGARLLRNPSNEAIAQVVGFVPAARHQDVVDLVVIGAGPAGLGAAVYGASEGLTTLALERGAVGGQAGTSTRIENYLGFPAGLSGAELAARAALQAEKFHARFSHPCAAVEFLRGDGFHSLRLSTGDEVLARAMIIATGAHYRKLDLGRLDQFEGMGVYYAATAVEANMCGPSQVALVGGGNSAGQAALYLAQSCRRVLIVIRRRRLADTMSRYLIDEIERRDNIELIAESEVKELLGDRTIDGVVVEHRNGERRRLDVTALFVFIGADPQTSWLGGRLALDERGFILTGRDIPAAPGDGATPAALETSIPGIFAAGDVRSGSIKRVASAVGEGAMAVHLVHGYLKNHPITAPPLAGTGR